MKFRTEEEDNKRATMMTIPEWYIFTTRPIFPISLSRNTYSKLFSDISNHPQQSENPSIDSKTNNSARSLCELTEKKNFNLSLKINFSTLSSAAYASFLFSFIFHVSTREFIHN